MSATDTASAVEGVYPDVYSVNFPYEFVHEDMVAGSEWPARPAGDFDRVPFHEPEDYVMLYVDGVGERLFNKANVTKVEPEPEQDFGYTEAEGGVLHLADLSLDVGQVNGNFFGSPFGTNIAVTDELREALGNPDRINVTIIAEGTLDNE